MPIIERTKHEELAAQLRQRYDTLRDAFEPRDLKDSKEGAKGGRWQYPEKLCATMANEVGLRMAVDDFKTILNEIHKLK